MPADIKSSSFLVRVRSADPRASQIAALRQAAPRGFINEILLEALYAGAPTVLEKYRGLQSLAASATAELTQLQPEAGPSTQRVHGQGAAPTARPAPVVGPSAAPEAAPPEQLEVAGTAAVSPRLAASLRQWD